MAAKKCSICKNRPQMTAAQRRAEGASREMDFCLPCLNEALWENTHSDDAHGTDQEGSNDTTGCWICHPELNEASADYRAPNGTSRKGMVMNVPIRATGREKANVVAEALGTLGLAVSVRTRKGIVTLKAAKATGQGVVLLWDTEGHYLYADSTATVNGKVRKVRNVAEALRIAAA